MAMGMKIKQAEAQLRKIKALLKKQSSMVRKYEQKQAQTEKYIENMKKQQ
jgi:hypothetical protein